MSRPWASCEPPQKQTGRRALHALLGIPAAMTSVGIIPIGHRAPDLPSLSLRRGRKPEAEYVHRERWQDPPAFRAGSSPAGG